MTGTTVRQNGFFQNAVFWRAAVPLVLGHNYGRTDAAKGGHSFECAVRLPCAAFSRSRLRSKETEF